MGRTVRAILIDPFKCSVTLVDHDATNLWTVYPVISHETARVSIFDVAYPADPFRDGDAIFYDSEGLTRPCLRFFRVTGHTQPIAGKGLILGADARGETADCSTSLAEVRRHTRFLERIDELGLVDTLTPWAPRHVAVD